MNVPEPAVWIVVAAGAKIAEQWQFDETEINQLLKNKNYKGHMRVGVTSNMSRSTVIVLTLVLDQNWPAHPSFHPNSTTDSAPSTNCH